MINFATDGYFDAIREDFEDLHIGMTPLLNGGMLVEVRLFPDDPVESVVMLSDATVRELNEEAKLLVGSMVLAVM